MRKIAVLLCLFLGLKLAAAEAPMVPSTIRFADLNLKLSDKARKKIQSEVDALTRNPKYFQIKVDRLQIYFPIIERIFREEGLPEDFKFLVLQESALISDAVSSSNAVGFWQFKKGTAVEVGLRVDNTVDERLNIVSSTRGAAKYIKKNNRIYFDNWVHALLAYQQGPGGAQKLVKTKYRGSNSMPIDGQTHWYVIKFLAHKVAFEQVKQATPELYLQEYYKGQGKSLKEISQQNQLEFSEVSKYNKWLRRGKVPSDKDYAVLLPIRDTSGIIFASGNKKEEKENSRDQGQKVSTRLYQGYPENYPSVQRYKNSRKIVKVNGIKAIRINEATDLSSLEKSTRVTTKRLLYYNDLKRKKRLDPGEIWYLKPKRKKAQEEYHVVEAGEDLWSVSQKYGIRLSQLRKKNQIPKGQTTAKPGRVLWLQNTRPESEPVVYQPIEEPEKKKIPEPTTKVPVVAEKKPAEPPVSVIENQQKEPVPEPLAKVEQPKTSSAPKKTESEKVAKTGQKVHLVQRGESLYSISRKYKVSIKDLQSWNTIENSSMLSIGQALIILDKDDQVSPPPPTLKEVKPGFLLHEVQQGETLYQIARDYDTTIKKLMEWNEKSDFNLQIGEELMVRKPR